MILAFDTSNYTTSVCIVAEGKVVAEWRTLVKVKAGDQGIRQSDAFFQHTQVLQAWVDEHLALWAPKLTAVSVSTRPRPVTGSYMPVFMAGRLLASTVAASIGIPLIETTHQEGHLYAALATVTAVREPLLFFHMSGGTTELHAIHYSEGLPEMTLVAETADISFGQLIDRIGVAAGLKFPCGAEMDRLAEAGKIEIKLPNFKASTRFNLSGYENFFKLLLNKYPEHPEWVFDALFIGIQAWLSQIVSHAVAETGIRKVLLAGGVAASQQISRHLSKNKRLKGIDLMVSDPAYACDNAFGVGLIGEEIMRRT